MTDKEFIKTIAGYCKKYYKKYGFKIISPAVAQACLESGFGKADNVKVKNNNVFGMKYRPNRLNCNKGIVEDKSKEQNPDGTYRDIITNWYTFENLEKCVEGYYQFINISTYKKVKEQADPKRYLEEIKKAGYATSINYVEKCMNLINEHNLTQYDENDERESDNVIYDCSVDFGNEKSNERTAEIKKITIHHMAGNLGAEACAKMHKNGTRKASANAYIGTDGKICEGVKENRRAWTSSNKTNDMCAITIEVANNSGAPDWTISQEAYNSLIKYCAYICKKYNIDPHFDGTKNGTITIHKMFAATACPGPYLENLIKTYKVEEDIKKILTNQYDVVEQIIDKKEEKTENQGSYLVRVKISDLNIREKPTVNSRPKGFIKPGVYTIIEEINGWGKLKSGVGYICLKYTERV